MSDTPTTTPEPASEEGALSGTSLEEIQDILDLGPEADEEKAGGALSRKAAAEPEPEKKAAPEAEEEKVDDPAPEEDAEKAALAEWNALKQRAAARRAARSAQATAPKETPAAAPAAAKEPAKEPEAAPAPKLSDVQQAAADIIAALELMDEEDEAAPAAAAQSDGIAKKARREADLTAIKEKIGVIAKAAEESGSIKAEVEKITGDLRARVQEFHDVAFVEGLAERAIADNEEALPFLAKRRDAAKLVVRFASDFLERKGKSAPMAFIADRVERVLARRAQEKNGAPAPEKNGAPAGAPEKQHPRKTMSSSHNSPPSKRAGVDSRTPAQVEADLFAFFGQDPHGD